MPYMHNWIFTYMAGTCWDHLGQNISQYVTINVKMMGLILSMEHLAR